MLILCSNYINKILNIFCPRSNDQVVIKKFCPQYFLWISLVLKVRNSYYSVPPVVAARFNYKAIQSFNIDVLRFETIVKFWISNRHQKNSMASTCSRISAFVLIWTFPDSWKIFRKRCHPTLTLASKRHRRLV